MDLTLDDDARQHLALFEDVTGADGIDCLFEDDTDGEPIDDRLIVVVSSGQMGEAIGPEVGRSTVRRARRCVGPARRRRRRPEFVANTLAPAAVYNVTISENEDIVAYVEVAEDDRGVAIGTNGRTIEAARRLADRHFDISDVQLI
ncbi:NusA-like transcription termination signal-binding factor [Natrialba swarupiae]|nr:NusA-like transcription termination signal-binding factor [Natrialba swarupiae]